MFIKIHARGFAFSEELKGHTEAKVRLTLGLYEEKIRRVDVFFTDINGPKGGEDMMCKIKITAKGHNAIVVQETAGDLREAIDVCSHRAKRSAGRRFERVSNHNRAQVYANSFTQVGTNQDF